MRSLSKRFWLNGYGSTRWIIRLLCIAHHYRTNQIQDCMIYMLIDSIFLARFSVGNHSVHLFCMYTTHLPEEIVFKFFFLNVFLPNPICANYNESSLSVNGLDMHQRVGYITIENRRELTNWAYARVIRWRIILHVLSQRPDLCFNPCHAWADDDSKCRQNVAKFSKNLNILEFSDYIWNHHEKCIPISTNIDSIDSVICELDIENLNIFDQPNPLAWYKTNPRVLVNGSRYMHRLDVYTYYVWW